MEERGSRIKDKGERIKDKGERIKDKGKRKEARKQESYKAGKLGGYKARSLEDQKVGVGIMD